MTATADATSSVRTAAAAWMRIRNDSRSWLFFALAGMVCVGVLLRLSNLNAPVRSPDERNYTYQASLILNQGRGAFPALISGFEEDASIPPPTRAGFLYLVAGVMALTGRTDVMAGVWLSCAASLVSLLLLARIAWRFFDPVAAVFAVTFYAVSCLPLMTSRRAWQDALVEMLTLILLLTGAEIVSGARHWLWSLVFTIGGAACITMKEIPAAVFLLVSACVLWRLFRARSNSNQRVLFSIFWIVSIAAALSWLIYLLGDPKLLYELPRMTSSFLTDSSYSRAYERGSAFDLLHGLWTISPFSTLCFPLGLMALAVTHSFSHDAPRDGHVAIFLAGFTLLLLAAALLVPHHLNFRYICPAFGPFYLIGGLGFSWTAGMIAQGLSRSHRSVFATCSILTIALCAAGDGAMFQSRFVRPDLQDLSIRMVLWGTIV